MFKLLSPALGSDRQAHGPAGGHYLRHLALLTAVLTGLGVTACENAERQVEQTFKVYTGDARVAPRFSRENSYVSVTGVWTIDGPDQIADPINISRILCIRSENSCTDQRSWISTGRGLSAPTLMEDQDFYQIVRWEGQHVQAEIESGGCRTISLDIRPNAVTTVTRSPPGCSSAIDPPVPVPRLGRLVSGDELDRARREHRRP